jgi:tricorn protease
MVGDIVVAVDGQVAVSTEPMGALLVQRAGRLTEVTLRRGEQQRVVVVRPLRQEQRVRYRSWVLANRRRVHAATDGRVGYLHIPDMGPGGYAEFHRDYAIAADHQALLVDVRFNNGGHVSQLLLEKLARRRIGFKVSRWGRPTSYPAHAIAGPIVCLTNEGAGSDGDIFTHAFKRLGLGLVVGTRTWGGTVGIWPRQKLVDQGATTQPEFSTWFEDIGFGLENHGAEPDIEVMITPANHAAGEDPQLKRAIEVVFAALTEMEIPSPPSLPGSEPQSGT